ncbi:hypothetical protein [Urbifossiella limnaea]|uniref:Uncharacterized protein n=1 Tax=Urbifossiella limnaea TaxID=2528023 RepID=A0A517XZY7_9BACT|nr:hypothetical protein [Urbifossiella limnaea]QDU23076.1 hypothetical protein ETAA1_50670 [Urbifossiella limnaea]
MASDGAAVLPLVRAAMARGEGPPAVREWVRAQGESARSRWTRADETRARELAAKLAGRLAAHRRAGADTYCAPATVG